MFVHYKSGVCTVTQSDTSLWENSRNMISSRCNKILHDPECHNQSCSDGFKQQPRTNNCGLEEMLDIAMCKSNESVFTPRAPENQFLFNSRPVNHLQVPEIQEVGGDDRRIECLQFGYNGQTKTKQYAHFCNLSTESEFKEKSHCKGVLKRKRKRTVFTTEQIIAMEGVFKKRPYVSREERLYLTQKLNVSENAIKIWFQNRRRVTERKEKDQSESCHSDSTVEEISEGFTARLDYIESHVKKNTDEFGFVTLDNNIITEIVSAIDVVLSRKINSEINVFELKNNANHSDSYCMYEPISPESLSEDNRDAEDTLKWIPSEPEESLQRLIDIQTILL